MKQLTHLAQEETFSPFEGLNGKIVHTSAATIVFWKIDEGALLPEHDHPQEQIAYVDKGELELTVAGVVHVLKPGMVLVIPGGTRHSARAITAVEMTDVFTPGRDDFPGYGA